MPALVELDKEVVLRQLNTKKAKRQWKRELRNANARRIDLVRTGQNVEESDRLFAAEAIANAMVSDEEALGADADVLVARHQARFPERTRTICNELIVGGTVYPLRLQLVGRYTTATGEFRVPLLGEGFVGRGPSLEKAYRAWLEKVHVEFQRLSATMPFEMSQDERSKCKLLHRMIDAEGHRERTPLVFRRIGRLSAVNPHETTWLDGEREQVRLRDAPGEFAGLKMDQCFEAIVLYDRKRSRVRRLLHVQPIDSIESLSEQARQEYLKTLPTATALPTVAWQDI